MQNIDDLYKLVNHPYSYNTLWAATALNGLRVAASFNPLAAAGITTLATVKFAYDIYQDENHDFYNVLNSYYENPYFQITANIALLATSAIGTINLVKATTSFMMSHHVIVKGAATTATACMAYDIYSKDDHAIKQIYNEYQNYINPIAAIAGLSLAASGVFYLGPMAAGYAITAASQTITLKSLAVTVGATGLASKIGYDIYIDEQNDPLNVLTKYAQSTKDNLSNLYETTSYYTNDINITPWNAIKAATVVGYIGMGAYCALNYHKNPFCHKMINTLSVVGSHLYHASSVVGSKTYDYITDLISEVSPNALGHIKTHLFMAGIAFEDPAGAITHNADSMAARYGFDSFSSSSYGDIFSNYLPYTVVAAFDTTIIGPGKFFFNMPVNHPILFTAMTASYIGYKLLGDGDYEICLDTPACFGVFAPQIAVGLGSTNIAIQSLPHVKDIITYNYCTILKMTTAGALLAILEALFNAGDEQVITESEITTDDTTKTAGELPDHNTEN